MALEALVIAMAQGTECTQATFKDGTDYTIEDVPAQRREYEEIVPANTSGKTTIRLTFTSGVTTVPLIVAILSGDTVAQKVAKLVAALNANATIAAIVTAVDNTTKATVTSDADDVLFNIAVVVESVADNACSVTQFLPSTRTLTFEYADGSTNTVNFPYVLGTDDEYQLTGLTQDYVIKTTMEIIPQVTEVGSDYESIIIPVFACNAYVNKASMAANYTITMQEIQCGDFRLDKMTAIDTLISASQYAASVDNLTGSQALLDQANSISDN
jgi:hypothetical protein